MAETTRSGNLGISANGQARQPSPLDYTAIFGALSSCSIPVLDLPPVEDDLDFRRCSVADYPEIFGGDDERDFAVSFEELLAFNDSSGIRFDDASNRDFRGGKLQAGSSSKSCDASIDDKIAEMNGLDDFSEIIIKQNVINEVKFQRSPSNFHDVAPTDDKKTEMNGPDCASWTKNKQNLADEVKITNHTPIDHNFDTSIKGCDLSGSSSDDQRHPGSSSLGKSSPSKSSDPGLLGNSMEKKVNMNPQSTQSEELTGNKEETEEFTHSVEDLSFDQKSTESPLRSISPSSDTYKFYDQVREFHHSRSSSTASLSSLDRMLSSDTFLKVTDISLRTKPLKVPPPRRAPPARPAPLDAEASVAAMKKAMEVAQARLRSAKASLEKKRESLQNQKRESVPEKGRGREEESGEWKVEEEFYELMKIPKVNEEKSKEREGNQPGKLETKWRASKEAFICEVGDNGALRKSKTSKSSEQMKRTFERETSCEVDGKGDGEERRRSDDGEFVHLENQKVLEEAERARRKLEEERERRRLEEERERVRKLREEEERERRLKEKVEVNEKLRLSREKEEAARRKAEEKEKEERERKLKEEEEREKERLRALREKDEAQRRKTEEEERERRRLEEERQSTWRLQKEEEERERRLKEEVEREKEKLRLLREEEEAQRRKTEEEAREKRRLEEEIQRAWRLQKEEEERERRLKEEVEKEKEKLRLLRQKEDAERRKAEEEKERKRLERERRLQEENMERQRRLHEEEEREREDEERARRELREREEIEGSNLKVSDEIGAKSEERVRGKWKIEEERMKFRKMESMMDRHENQRDKWRTEKGKEIEADEDERERKKQEEQREREQEREKDRLAAERAARETNERAAMEKSLSRLKTEKLAQEGKPATSPGLRVSESGETPIRSRARMERHQRTVERAAKALAEKNLRDVIAQREQAERNRLAESLDAEIRRWSNGKEGNLRALLSTLQYILGSESGWHPVPLTEVLTAQGVKRAYRKATLCVHPDKLQQRGASIQQKYICEKVFDLLKEAWSRFNSEER